MEEKVLQYVLQEHLIVPGDRVIVGLSGGADSVCLLSILQSLSGRVGFELAAVHINHGIRGCTADRDENYSRELAGKYGIPFYAYHEDIPSYASHHGISEELAGRRVRYADFTDAAEKWNATKIAAAHHENDQAETVLFRLFRGTGVAGLSGMAPIGHPEGVEIPVIRPLLCLSKKEILLYLHGKEIPWVEDETNLDYAYARNRIRGEILPSAEMISEGAVHRIARLAAMAKETEEYLSLQTDDLYRNLVSETAEAAGDPAGTELFIDRRELARLHPLMQKRILRKAVSVYTKGIDLGEVHTLALLELSQGPTTRRLELPGGVEARTEYDRLIIGKPATVRESGDDRGEDCSCENGGVCMIDCLPGNGECRKTVELSDGRVMHLQIEAADEDAFNFHGIPSKAYTKWFDYDKIKDTLCVRTRKTGDRMTINGKGDTKSLNRILIDDKVPANCRNEILLLADEREIIWIIGGRISEAYKVEESTVRTIKVWIEGGQEDE